MPLKFGMLSADAYYKKKCREQGAINGSMCYVTNNGKVRYIVQGSITFW